MIWEKRTTKMRMRMIEVGLMLKIVAGGGVGTLLFLFFLLWLLLFLRHSLHLAFDV